MLPTKSSICIFETNDQLDIGKIEFSDKKEKEQKEQKVEKQEKEDEK